MIGYITSFLALLLRGSARSIYIGFLLLKRTGLWIVLVMLVSIIPQLLGSYTYLRSQGLEWYYALVSAFGVEMGGAMFTMWNNFNGILAGGVEFSTIALVIGMGTSITTMLWMIYLWFKANRLMVKTMPTLPIIIIGMLVFGLMLINTLMIDQYVLTDQSLRVSGMTIFLEHPQESIKPLTEGNYTAPNSTLYNQTANQTGIKTDEIIGILNFLD